MKSARDGWNAAQIASERELPKQRKMHGPVGEKVNSEEGAWRAHVSVGRGTFIGFGEVSCCTGCGYHICSCEPVAPDPVEMPRAVFADDYQRHVDAHNEAVAALHREMTAQSNVPRYVFDQAAAAEHCRMGRVVRLVLDSAGNRFPKEFLFRFDGDRFEQRESGESWRAARFFPHYTDSRGRMRFELVDAPARYPDMREEEL